MPKRRTKDPDTPIWLDATGPWPHLALSTRVRLARNLSAIPFWGRNTPADRERVVEDLRSAMAQIPSLAGTTVERLDRMPRIDRLWYHEQQLVSRDLAGLGHDDVVRSGAALARAEPISLMLNEEDHLRLQALVSGFALPSAYQLADAADAELGLRLSFAFHPEFGYLTGCPTNVGTGLRASVLLHLPALVLTREIGKVLHGLTQIGLTYRGLYGEGSEVLGNLFQVSNQATLGKSEGELLEHLGRLVLQVMEHEEHARDVLRRDALGTLEDKVWRAYGLMGHARALAFEEALNLLSGVRLGVGMGLLPGPSMRTLNELLMQSQDAHLARGIGVELGDGSLPVARATMVRQRWEEQERDRA